MKNKKPNILIAIPNVSFAEGLKKQFSNEGYPVADIAVSVEFLFETLEQFIVKEDPINTVILSSDLAKKLKDKRLEFLSDSIYTIRENYSETEFILLANETAGHPFLAEIVQLGIYNIFIKGVDEMSVKIFMDTIKKPKTFASVSHLRGVDSGIPWRRNDFRNPNKIVLENRAVDFQNDESLGMIDEPEAFQQPQQPLNEENSKETKSLFNMSDKLPTFKLPTAKPKSDRPVVQKVIQKQVIQKQVNKQVIQRKYQLELKKSVEKQIGVAIERQLILVGSPFHRTGTTFFAHMLAKYIADIDIKVSYVESPFMQAYSYDRFYGHRTMDNYLSSFYEYTRDDEEWLKLEEFLTDIDMSVLGKPVHEWNLEGVDLIVKHPTKEPIYEPAEITLEVFAKILLSLHRTPVTIIDVGTDWDKEVIQDLYQIADHVFIVLEPDIPNIEELETSNSSYMTYVRKLLDEPKTHMVGNRFTPKIHEELLDTDEELLIPNFDTDQVFAMQYKGSLTLPGKKEEKLLHDAFEPIIEMILPKEYIKKKRRKWLKGLGSLGKFRITRIDDDESQDKEAKPKSQFNQSDDI